MDRYTNPSFSLWDSICSRSVAAEKDVTPVVSSILERVRTGGDSALFALSKEIDGIELSGLEVTEDEFAAAEASVSPAVKLAISKAYSNIESFHRAQMPLPVDMETSPGVRCCQRPVPICRVGLYIPGGTAPLFSTVLMLSVPAKVAGCPEVFLCTPVSRQTGQVSPEVLYAARFCGVDRVFKLGGAQAIGALAYGTQTVPRVDKIFGPGNRFVTTAKQMVGGRLVSIDMPAGPSEVMVVADGSADPAFVAADLLSQAEHGPDSQVMLVCDSAAFADSVESEIYRQTAALGRSSFVEAALAKSRTVIFDGPEFRRNAAAFANAYASEHLILSVRDPWSLSGSITSAGSIFIGNYSPESAGDYASGTNHTLPTSGWARSCSGVNIDSFIRKITYQELTHEGLSSLAETIVDMAEAEGLQAHANAVKIRMSR